MVPEGEKARVQRLITDTLTALCRNGLKYQFEFSIEATVGITLDKEDVVLVSVNENIQASSDAGFATFPADGRRQTHTVRKKTKSILRQPEVDSIVIESSKGQKRPLIADEDDEDEQVDSVDHSYTYFKQEAGSHSQDNTYDLEPGETAEYMVTESSHIDDSLPQVSLIPVGGTQDQTLYVEVVHGADGKSPAQAKSTSPKKKKNRKRQTQDDNIIQIPALREPLSKMTFIKSKELIVKLVRAEAGGMSRRVSWGKPDAKPTWWPDDVPWSRRGVQQGLGIKRIKLCIEAAYRHYGLYHDETQTTAFFRRKQQPNRICLQNDYGRSS